jgi:hypothetical protein
MIRQIDQDRLILFEASLLGGGFLSNPSGPGMEHKDVISYGSFCPFANEQHEPTSVGKCKLVDDVRSTYRNANIKSLKVGSMMTEFGGLPTSKSGLDELRRVVGAADANKQSWFWWQYKSFSKASNREWEHSFFYPNGSLQSPKVF